MRHVHFIYLVSIAVWIQVALAGCSGEQPTLIGRAVLPAASFAAGPTSGVRLGTEPINGQTVPFVDKQPVQGISAVAAGEAGRFWALSDNGFGNLENSADFHLRVYRIRPRFKTASGGEGDMVIEEIVELRDSNGQIPFAITNQRSPERILTGADFDVESLQVAPDGTWWIGDEFGPFLLHFDRQGVLLDPPLAVPDFDNWATTPGQEIRSPQNPFHEETSAVRIMNAVHRDAVRNGGSKVPVFSPDHTMLRYDGSSSSTHYARGRNPQTGLTAAAGDIFDLASLQAAGYPVVTWTVNDKDRMVELLRLGVDGIISDRPDFLYQAVSGFDADEDGTPGDYLTADGRIDSGKFDAQGHRGAGDLRPENTLPAMEAALDNLMVTLETDVGITADRLPMLHHDPYIDPNKCRFASGASYNESNQEFIKNNTAADIQERFICDRVIRGTQENNPALSPVADAFTKARAMHLYAIPTLKQLFDFADFYANYYRDGDGKDTASAAVRAANAEAVRFNIETKINPRSDADNFGNVYRERTVDHEVFADVVSAAIIERGWTERVALQSFDFRPLLRVQERHPQIRTGYLFGDFPIYPAEESGDGANLQTEGGANTPWLAGLYWPYRMTEQIQSFRARTTGGFEGMALSADGSKLLPMLEKPLDGIGQELTIYEFDLGSKTFTGVRHVYRLDEFNHAIGAFIMFNDTQGLVIERDNSQGVVQGYKFVHRITLQGDGQVVEKTPVVNLNAIADPNGIGAGLPGDVGIGGGTFAFPFVTIESVIVLDDNRIGIINDNNYPFSVGRHLSANAPDDTEFIDIQLPASAGVTK